MNRAESIDPARAAAEAVKAYLRMQKGRLIEDAELLALLLPERFGDGANVSDYQHFVIEKLRTENAALKAERDGLRRVSDRGSLMREGVRRLVLELIEAKSIEDAIGVATGAADTLSVDRVSLGVESGAPLPLKTHGVCLIPAGLSDRLIEREAAGALMKGGAHPALFGGNLEPLQSVAVFRLRIGPDTPAALYAVGAREADRFDDEGETREMAYFVRALERTIGAWLALPRN